jgi:hypothetical protein
MPILSMGNEELWERTIRDGPKIVQIENFSRA